MNQGQTTSAQNISGNYKPAPGPSGKALKDRRKVFVGLAVLILLLIILWAIFGRGGQKGEEIFPSPTPSPTETPTPTPVETEEPSPSPTPKPKTTPTPTPTPSPTPTPTPPTQTKTITSTASLDGFRASNGGGNASVDIRAGRNVNLITRGFVSFDLADIPAGATIEKATLRLYQTKVAGSPYGVGGSLKVDHLDYGDSLENADYGASSISASFATLTGNAAVEWKDVDVADRVKNDLANGRTRSQFRTHFQIENTGGDVTGDFAYFESADNSEGTANIPQLVVKYH